jgi:hypothetical protein
MRIDNQMAGFRVTIHKPNVSKKRAGERLLRSSSKDDSPGGQSSHLGKRGISGENPNQAKDSNLYNDSKIKRAIHTLVSGGNL